MFLTFLVQVFWFVVIYLNRHTASFCPGIIMCCACVCFHCSLFQTVCIHSLTSFFHDLYHIYLFRSFVSYSLFCLFRYFVRAIFLCTVLMPICCMCLPYFLISLCCFVMDICIYVFMSVLLSCALGFLFDLSYVYPCLPCSLSHFHNYGYHVVKHDLHDDDTPHRTTTTTMVCDELQVDNMNVRAWVQQQEDG